MTASREQWRGLLAPYGAPAEDVDAVYDDIAARHAEPARRYHTLAHVGEVLSWVDRVAGDTDGDMAAVRMAAWTHDVVYDPRSAANEAASAEWARTRLASLGVPAAVVAEVARLVELTAAHDPDTGDRAGEVVSDADLAVLGAPSDLYLRYVHDVRAEYAWLSEPEWRSGRARVLAGFAARPWIYRTVTARTELEDRARENIAWELSTLGAAPPP